MERNRVEAAAGGNASQSSRRLKATPIAADCLLRHTAQLTQLRDTDVAPLAILRLFEQGYFGILSIAMNQHSMQLTSMMIDMRYYF